MVILTGSDSIERLGLVAEEVADALALQSFCHSRRQRVIWFPKLGRPGRNDLHMHNLQNSLAGEAQSGGLLTRIQNCPCTAEQWLKTLTNK